MSPTARTNKFRNVPTTVDGILFASKISDFAYYEGKSNHLTVEDSKGFETPEFKLKAKLMKAVHGIEVKLT